jgi:hypothetical protein
MPELLAKEAKPVLLYTVVPEEAASANGTDNSAFHFDENGCLTTLVAGGGAYSHRLWDYASDSFLVTKRVWGIPYRSVAYAVERKQVGKHRQLVLLAPVKVFKGPLAASLAGFLLETKPLRRFNPIMKAGGEKFVRFNVMSPEGVLSVTTARPNASLCATVTCVKDDCVATVARLGTTKLMLPTTVSWVEDRTAAAILTDYHRLKGGKAKHTVYPVELGVRAFQFKPSEYDQDAKTKLQSFMSPLIHGAFAPVPNKAGEEQCVEGRINSLKKPEPKPSMFREQCINEFANLVVAGAHLEPVCYDVVAAKQTSAAQRLSLERAVTYGTFRKPIVKCFLKAEAYPDVKDPRNITTYNDADKLDMAGFSLAMSAYLKDCPWYGPGKTPLEIATRVTQICETADFVNISDYKRMDGTITMALRKVERAVMMKAFPQHRAKLNELFKSNVNNKGFLPHGTTFEQGSSQGSGCSATSLFQTLRAAFTAFLAFRHTEKYEGGPTYNAVEAYGALGIHLGDDGLDAGLPIRSHKWAATSTGLILEAQTVSRGHRGVNFLARYYSKNVWLGDTNSMCDIKRQLSKFHTTVRLPENVTKCQKLVEKAQSFVVTDGQTPVLGELCNRVLVLLEKRTQRKHKPRVKHGIGNYWSKFESNVQYPNVNVGGWMDSEFRIMLPKFDRSIFGLWLVNAQTIEELLDAPLCQDPEPATPGLVSFVVDEEVVPPRSPNRAPQETEPEPARAQPEKKTPRTKPSRARSTPTARSRQFKSAEGKGSQVKEQVITPKKAGKTRVRTRKTQKVQK